ncbi:hypothetical protein FACS1894177_03980 [Bacteroidia bacterium]|nr:hypothetical protein FACS1894177_03980 [Bacteroidia bacterium]
MDKIEFYKNRTLSERFSASVDFLKQNWKILYKNILIGALPLAIAGGYFLQYYQQASFTNVYSGNTFSNPLFVVLYLICMVSLMIYLNAMTGAVLIKYHEGNLDSSTGWGDLYSSMMSLSAKTFLIGLIIWSIIVVAIAFVAIIISLFFSGITLGEEMAFFGIILLFVVLILLGFVLIFSPFLALAHYPAYFSGAGIWESIKIAFGMGFRNWGNVVVTLLLSGIVMAIISMIFSVPNSIVAMFFSRGEISILTFIFAFIALLGNVLTYPVMFIFIAFQYFSIVENEQGVSLQSKVDEFENL